MGTGDPPELWDGNGGRVILNKYRMPTSETAAKADSQPQGGGSPEPEALVTYKVITEGSPASSVAPGQSLLRRVTVEPTNLETANLNASDFPTQLSDLATLESIQAELDRIQNSSEDGDNIAASTSSLITLSSPAVTMTSADGASFVGSLSDGSNIVTTSNAQGGTQIVNVLQDDTQVLSDNVKQTVHNIQTKRPLAAVSNSGQVVTKVIITKNPNQTQPVAIPVSNQQIVMMGSQGLTTVSHQMGLGSPTKTITINPSLLQSPTKYITALPGSPTKFISGQKIALSPVKTPTKITMIPVSSMSKSPQRIVTSTGQVLTMVAKAQSGSTSLTSASSTRPATITMSPSKVILKQQPITNQSGQKVIMQQLNTQVPKMQGIPLSSVPNIQPVSVSGSKFQYVRLVTNPAAHTQTTLATAKPASIAPMTLQAKPIMTTANTQMKITLPSAAGGATTQVTQAKLVTRPALQQGQQRIILPATSQVSLRPNQAGNTLAQIRPAGGGAATLTQLPPGTTIISSGQNLSGVQGFALVPAQYVTQQLGQQLTTPQVGTTVQRQESGSGFVPISTTSVPEPSQPRQNINGSLLQEPSGQRPRKPCNCTKSQCLKLYCDCFANGEFCHNCNCTNCANNLDHEEERSRAIKACLDRNPLAFHPKIGKGRGERRHTKGCNCKRSGCLKNYCECYEAKILCTSICKCVGCKNFEESPDRKTLMHLADAAEVRVQQQTSAKAKLSSQIQDLPIRPPQPNTGERYAYTFVTKEVAEATCACLIAQAEEAERMRQLEMVQERMILEEFGRCLMQVIESAGRTKAPSPAP